LPTITPPGNFPTASLRRRADSTRARWAQDGYERLPRARKHTEASLRSLRHATSAPDRREGVSAPPTPADVLAAVPTWTSRKSMIRVIRALSAQPYVIELCRRAGVSPETWRSIVTNDAIDADTATGRGLRTSQTVAAARVNRGEKQVQRARSIAIKLGIMVEVYRARELSKAERLALTAEHPGHKQRGLANVYHLTVCGPRQRARIGVPQPGQFAQVGPHSYANVHLPPEGGLSLLTHLLDLLPLTAAAAAEEAEPPPAAQHQRRRLPGMALAFEVLAHPGLAILLDGVRPGTIAAQLAPYRAGGWHGHALAVALLTEADRLGIITWEPARSPWALLKVLLSRIDPVADVHLGVGVAVDEHAPPGRPPRPEPCGGPDCDGYGWINLVDERGYAAARPCPDCAPNVRSTWVDELAAEAGVDENGEPPF